MNQELIREFIFWGIWLVIPLLIDIISGLLSGYYVFRDYFRRERPALDYFPHVTILVPLYNSSRTLGSCLKSILDQDYPTKNITVILVNNGPGRADNSSGISNSAEGIRDGSYDIFASFQQENPSLRLWWADSPKGKAKALNKGLYMADGKYIINIDSDGILDRNAVKNIVARFESRMDIQALTGVVLINNKLIQKQSSLGLKLLQRCELFEYTEAFLVGRGFQSRANRMFTLAGAFSCYRRDAILKTQLYNNDTLGEDTHMTSQIREFLKGRVELCEDAFFYVDPVESLDRLYIQRQRWQRGQVEVSSLFKEISSKNNRGFKNVIKFTMIKDHTLVFPRFIWMFASIYLIFMDYPLKLIVGANIIMYLAYVFNSFIYFLVSRLYLKGQKRFVRYIDRYWHTIFLLPVYRLIVFFMRVAGIINSVEKRASWNTKTFTAEKLLIGEKLRSRFKFYYRFRNWVNNE